MDADAAIAAMQQACQDGRPITVIIADASMSMEPFKAFVRGTFAPGAGATAATQEQPLTVALAVSSNHPRVIAATHKLPRVAAAVEPLLNVMGTDTALFDAVGTAVDIINTSTTRAVDAGHTPRISLAIFTDGEDNASMHNTAENVETKLASLPDGVIVRVVVVGMSDGSAQHAGIHQLHNIVHAVPTKAFTNHQRRVSVHTNMRKATGRGVTHHVLRALLQNDVLDVAIPSVAPDDPAPVSAEALAEPLRRAGVTFPPEDPRDAEIMNRGHGDPDPNQFPFEEPQLERLIHRTFRGDRDNWCHWLQVWDAWLDVAIPKYTAADDKQNDSNSNSNNKPRGFYICAGRKYTPRAAVGLPMEHAGEPLEVLVPLALSLPTPAIHNACKAAMNSFLSSLASGLAANIAKGYVHKATWSGSLQQPKRRKNPDTGKLEMPFGHKIKRTGIVPYHMDGVFVAPFLERMRRIVTRLSAEGFDAFVARMTPVSSTSAAAASGVRARSTGDKDEVRVASARAAKRPRAASSATTTMTTLDAAAKMHEMQEQHAKEMAAMHAQLAALQAQLQLRQSQ